MRHDGTPRTRPAPAALAAAAFAWTALIGMDTAHAADAGGVPAPAHTVAPPGEASPLGPRAPSFHADVEIDPVAYVLDGYSLHAGIGWDRWRVDLGVFAIRVPEFLHGNEGFTASADGFSVKLQYFPFDEQSGLFGGVSAGLSRRLVERDGSDLADRQRHFNAGVNLGYRIELFANFFVTPWLAADYGFGGSDVTLGGETFEHSPLTVVPLIHLGYQLR